MPAKKRKAAPADSFDTKRAFRVAKIALPFLLRYRNLAILAGAAGVGAWWLLRNQLPERLRPYRPPHDFKRFENTPDLP